VIFSASFKNRIIVILSDLPFGLGSNFAIPVIKWLLSIFYYYPQSQFDLVQRKRFIRCEAKIIDEALLNGINQVTIVYDNYISPPTYGDFLYVVLLARFFKANGIRINFFITDGEFRSDWHFTSIEASGFVDEQIKLAEALLNSPLVKIEKLSWGIIQQRILSDAPNLFIPFSKEVKARIGIYKHCFNLVNHLLSDKEDDLVDRVLFSFEDLVKDVIVSPVKAPYVSCAFRYSLLEGDDIRNTTVEEIIAIHTHLRQRFPHCSIMIISDINGCEYLSKLAQVNNINCIFSKQFSTTFLGDGLLILNSEFYFQVRGGGIGVFPQFSRMPYEIVTPLVHEIMWSNIKLTSFQSQSQLFTNGSEWL
jgi:hypothetical protein